MTERKPPGMSWESFVEQQIREAQEAGKFDHLPGFGQPLADLDEPHDEMRWLKEKLQRENISILPPALEIRLDVARTREALGMLNTENEVRQAIEALNQRIRQTCFAIRWGPPSTTMPLDVEEVLAEWRERKRVR